MNLTLNNFSLQISVRMLRHGHWVDLALKSSGAGYHASIDGLRAHLAFAPERDGFIDYDLNFTSSFATRLRLGITLHDQKNLFHLIPGSIHGDNNAAHVRPGEFPCLTVGRTDRNCSPVWEFRADRASHPVSILCCKKGAVGISIDPYSDCKETEDGFIRNGVFAELPNTFGVCLGYGNDPLTFNDKTFFLPATADLSHGANAKGRIYAFGGQGRLEAHHMIRDIYGRMRELPQHHKSYRDALSALADSFATISWSPELQQYTNCRCQAPTDTALKPWRAIVEVGWTGGSVLAYPFSLAERLFPDLQMPKSSSQIFDEICGGYNDSSGFINDTCLNVHTKNIPQGWNQSTINGWWSGFLPQTKDNHCAYNQGHAAYYLLKTILQQPKQKKQDWLRTALCILDTAIDLQREDGAFGYIFSSRERKVIDYDGFAGCWFAAALPLAWKLTGEDRYRRAAARALPYYWSFIRDFAAWGTPMDTCKSIDSEGNLAFIRASRLMHEFTGHDVYAAMLSDGANYEYLWRYGFRTRPQCPPLSNSPWNSCGGSITSVSNPHMHPMSIIATEDLKYLSRLIDDPYHDRRAEDGIAWIMNTLELYPETMSYGRYGVLSERTCPSDGLLSERFADSGAPASTWWSYNAWAAASAMEAIGERMIASGKETDEQR